ncbi:MAG: phenylacetic acid degradation bifunctional protein PaaZ, partial [Acidimicrobiia bacterium]
MRTLESYLAGSWYAPAAGGAVVRDATTGDEVARVSSEGADLAAAVEHARRVGGPALRSLTFHQRAGLLKA